ncbi:PAS domain S-box protein [Cuspidothrix issatschenkoi]|uniref:histidine kinase n=1 Tax=Cuspidothrix issatschenkoi CHARLIE-1 TaxID=2052836 RepID=A0A2S6CVQ3_9CYAN|nr:PAS domain S-box protein [Cuspidothrix issatschenkoi]PPJ63680.1 histidine kinase [Cuspidothrix issatschenkoi CHARLIE-1]
MDIPNLQQIINYSPLTISPDSSVIDAIHLMNRKQDHIITDNQVIQRDNDYVLVVDDGKLKGIFTINDVLRVIALNINLSTVKITEVMIQPVITLKESESNHIFIVLELLGHYCINHLPIVDNKDKLIGIVTNKNLLQVLDIETIVNIFETFKENLTNSNLEHSGINHQQINHNCQKRTRNKLHSYHEINQELEETLEELQIAEEELRKQNEQLILAREITEAERQRYQNLFHFAPNGYVLTNVLGVIQEANYAMESLLGVRQNRLIGKPLWIYIAKPYRSEYQSRLKKLDHLQEWEIYLQPREDAPFPSSMRVSPFIDNQGNTTGYLWSICDIRDRKQLEARLRQDSDILEMRVAKRTSELVIANERLQQEVIEREKIQRSLEQSEARLTLALEAGNIGIWDWDINTNQIVLSSNMAQMYGLTSCNVFTIDENFWNFIYPEEREHFRQGIINAIEKKVDFVCEYRVMWSDGSVHWLSSRGKVHNDENGQPQRIIGTTRDISERKEIEQQLSEQAALLNIATDGIFVRDFETKILFWNQGAEKIYGWENQEVLGKNIKDIFYKSISYEQEIVALKAVFKSGYWEGELRKQTKSKEEIIVQSRWTLMLDAHGGPKAILTVDTDITEKKQLEKQFFRAQRMESIGTLAGGIAHDINNILTPILGSAQLLKGRLAQDKARHDEMLTMIENNVKQGAALVKQMLSFARGVEGKYTILQVNDLINDIIQFSIQTLPKSIVFFTDLAPRLWTVSGDETQLHQVLMNLIVNAGDAMPNGGNLSISTENLYINEEMMRRNCDVQIGNYIVITVRDTGTGMAPKTLERIFEPFFTTKDFGKGTGLGLSTVLGIIKSHKGCINVNSKVGQGSTFQIFLPSVNQKIIPVDTDNQAIHQGQGELILLVDDEEAIREVTKAVLESYNYQSITAKNGMEAITIYAQYQDQIKVVLMDMMMPEMDGNTAIRTLKTINPQVKIIACSGRNIQHLLEGNDETQVTGILLKPYSNEELLEKLHFALR